MDFSKRNEDRLIVYIIFNSILPYAYEANNILALPNGMPYRARFRREWHPEIENPKDIENRNGLLVLRDWVTGRFYPLRRISTTKVDLVGDIYYIDYILRELIEFDSDKVSRAQQVDSFNERISFEIRPYPNNPGGDLQKLVFLGPDLVAGISDSHPKGDIEQKEFNNWGKIVSLIGETESYLDIDFLKIIRLMNEGEKEASFVVASGMKRYALDNSKIYYLDVFQRSFTTKIGDSSVSNREIIVSAETDAINLIRDRFAVVGKYDRYRFRLKTQAPQRTRETDIAIDIRRSDGKGPIPTIYLPVRITTPLTTVIYRVIAVIVFFLGATVLLFSDTLFPGNKELAQSVAILSMILSGQGMREAFYSALEWLKVSFTKL
jgi:hypothetical protein